MVNPVAMAKKTKLISPSPFPSQQLHNLVEKGNDVKVLVEESADDLSVVNSQLRNGLQADNTLPLVEKFLKKNEAIEEKVKTAVEKLTYVNFALANEVSTRVMLEHRLASATEQELATRHAAFHDALTGLPNRALFEDRLEHGLAQAKRHGRNLAVLFLDLDDFKIINDSYGHDVGDHVLKTIAQRLLETTRNVDTISRHGGDEFLYLVMESRTEQDIELIAGKILRAVQAPCQVNTTATSISLDVSTSIGIAIFPKDGTTAEALVKGADTAMYQAKQGKSRFAFAQ